MQVICIRPGGIVEQNRSRKVFFIYNMFTFQTKGFLFISISQVAQQISTVLRGLHWHKSRWSSGIVQVYEESFDIRHYSDPSYLYKPSWRSGEITTLWGVCYHNALYGVVLDYEGYIKLCTIQAQVIYTRPIWGVCRHNYLYRHALLLSGQLEQRRRTGPMRSI
jgi:hypothetical protein